MFSSKSDSQAWSLGLKGQTLQHHRDTLSPKSASADWVGGGGGGGGAWVSSFPPHCPGFSSQISHSWRTVVRMNELLQAKHSAGGRHSHSTKAQITAIVFLLSAKTILAKLKSTVNQNREGDSFGSHFSDRETFVNHQAFSWEPVGEAVARMSVFGPARCGSGGWA